MVPFDAPTLWLLGAVALLIVVGLGTAVWAIRLRRRLVAALATAEERRQSLATALTALHEAQERAESATRARNEFLGNVGHEIRTPINGILSIIELVLDTDPTAEQREFLAIIKSSADALMEMLRDILDLARLESGKLQLEPTDFRLREMLNDALKAPALRARAKGLAFNCDIAPEVPDALIGDPVRLRQILALLLGNAIKFTERGQVAVRVKTATNPKSEIRNPKSETASDFGFRISELGREIALHFEVRDTGIGIRPDKLGAIFEPFTQGDGSTTRKYGGSGVGLSLAQRLVHLMQGQLQVESRAGVGSTFEFTVRLERRAETAAVPARERDAQSVSGTV